MNQDSTRRNARYFSEAVIFTALSFAASFLTFLVQAVFSRVLAPGEFGLFSAGMGLVLLLGVPLSAVNQTLIHYFAQFHAQDHQDGIARLHFFALSTLRFTALITAMCALAIVIVFPWLLFPTRPALKAAVLVTALVSVATMLSGGICLGRHRFRLWGTLVIGAALLRLILGMVLTGWYPHAEMAMVITAASSFVTAAPVFLLQNTDQIASRVPTTIAEKGFLRYLAAATSVMLALFIFCSGDQIIAQYCFGPAGDFHDISSQVAAYDNYQAAGLLGRALLWGAGPILAVAFTQISQETLSQPSAILPLPSFTGPAAHRGLHKSLQLLLFYFGTLLFAAIVLWLLRKIVGSIFQGHSSPQTAHLIAGFVFAMVPLGMLQAVGIFCLAGKYFAECFAFGISALIYATVLRFFGKNPDQMLSVMFVTANIVIGFMLLVTLCRRVKAPRCTNNPLVTVACVK